MLLNSIAAVRDNKVAEEAKETVRLAEEKSPAEDSGVNAASDNSTEDNK